MFTPAELTNILVIAFMGLLLVAAYTDFRFFKIPNRIVASILILYPAYVVSSPVAVAWETSLLAAGVLFVVGLFLFQLNVMGGGDVKLLTAVTLWAGLDNYLMLMIAVAIAGLLLIPVSAFVTSLKLSREEAAQSGGAGTLASARIYASAFVGMRFVHLKGHWTPYGVAIAVGGIFVGTQFVTL